MLFSCLKYFFAQSTNLNQAIRVIFLSTSWEFNPYQDCLIANLNAKGLKASIHAPSLIFFHNFLFKDITILHIQFVQHFLASNVIHGWFRFSIFTCQVLLLRLVGVKIIWTVHEWIDKTTASGNYTPSPLQTKILGAILGAMITHCDSSKNTIIKTAALGQNYTKKIFTIPHHNYIETYPNQIERDVARQQLGIEPESIVFLHFGSIHRSKGVVEAIEAFKGVDHGMTQLIITGQLPDDMRETILEKAANCPNVSLVDPPAPIPEEKIQVYMNASDVVVLPYTLFTASGVAVLAMSFKKACIAPNTGFFKDILDPAGAFLYDPATQDGLVNAIKSAIAQREHLPKMGQHNFETAQLWTWDYITQKTIEVYKFVLSAS